MEVKTIVVIGAGIMGRGIAHVSALRGYQTYIVDVSNDLLKKCLLLIEKEMDKGVERGKINLDLKNEALKRLLTTTSIEKAVRQADFIIEAVPEDIELKHRIFKEIEQFCPSHAVLATNTSSMSITEIASAVKCPQKVIGMHFFNPVHKMKLVEIIRGLETSDDVCEITTAVAVKMHKETVVINEFPGFATSRINAMIGNEAFYMLMEGVGTAEDIDKALKLGLNHPMGPFEMGDLVGWDTRLKVLQYLHQNLGEKFRPCPLLVKYVKAGRFGRKVGRGVYEYDSNGNKGR